MADMMKRPPPGYPGNPAPGYGGPTGGYTFNAPGGASTPMGGPDMSASSGPPTKHGLPRTRLPEFDGTSKWKPFEARVEGLRVQYKLSDIETANLLGQCLTGKAAAFYADLPTDMRLDYTRLRAKFRKWYGEAETCEMYRYKLTTAKQESKQSLTDFAQHVNYLASEAYPGNPLVADEQAAQTFVKGCSNKRAARWAMDNKPANLDDALEAVRTWVQREQVINGSPPRSRSPSPYIDVDKKVRAVSPGPQAIKARQSFSPSGRQSDRGRQPTKSPPSGRRDTPPERQDVQTNKALEKLTETIALLVARQEKPKQWGGATRLP